MSDFLVMALESDAELYHHGIEGQKWGERRYQNYDGSLTDEGRKRYGVVSRKEYKQDKKQVNAARREGIQAAYNYQQASKTANYRLKKAYDRQGNLKNLSPKKREALLKAISAKSYFEQDYNKRFDNAVNLTKDAKEKYGDSKIKDLKVKATNVGGGQKEYLMYGSTLTGMDYVDALAASAAINAITVPTIGMAVIGLPSDNGKKAFNYAAAYKDFSKKYDLNDPDIPRAYQVMYDEKIPDDMLVLKQ